MAKEKRPAGRDTAFEVPRFTAMAHKLARILWHMLKYRQPYDPNVWAAAEEKQKKKKLHRLHQNAAALGYQLVCAPIT